MPPALERRAEFCIVIRSHAPARSPSRTRDSKSPLGSRDRLILISQREFLATAGGLTGNQHASLQNRILCRREGIGREADVAKPNCCFPNTTSPALPSPYSQKPEAVQGNTCQLQDVNKACSESVFFKRWVTPWRVVKSNEQVVTRNFFSFN